MNEPKRVVVIGAGFGGLAACEALMEAPVEVVLVDRHNYNTFQPLLYQVATAGLNPGDIAYPVRAYARRHPSFKFRQDVVTGVDFRRRQVSFADGDPIDYDYLVLAAGAATNFFAVPGAEQHARGIYTMEDAVAVRNIVSSTMERAASHGAGEGDLTVVIVGGGPTGVEMAGTLAELRQMELHTTYTGIEPSRSRVVLVEQRDRVLAAFHPRLSAYAARVLADRGGEVRCEESVKEVQADRVVLASGEVLSCRLVVWAAGVGSCALTESLDLPKVRGRLEVGSDLRVAGHDSVFAIGDMAAAHREDGADPLPQLAQPAIQEGHHTGKQIARLLRGEAPIPFVYKDKGIMATIGRRAAVAEFPSGLRLRATPAWLAWLALHLVFLLGVRNRTSVLVNWAWRYVSWGHGSKVIAGV
ncbi:MAG TPA: NAD(P)/FAD-dependent oxidoreductase [Acidimicrobiales bacterium]|nr:NAD(P)/FAD-dependent oxidoreductase [Acidimicrobiales bacterium]